MFPSVKKYTSLSSTTCSRSIDVALQKHSIRHLLLKEANLVSLNAKIDTTNFPLGWVLPIMDLTDPTRGDALRR